MTKKTKKLQENQKKTNMSLRPNILWKVLFFWFFGFSRGFVKIILLKEKSFIKGRVFTTLHNSWKCKIEAKKNTHTHTHLNIEKNNKIPQIAVNCQKVWVLGGGGTIYIYIYLFIGYTIWSSTLSTFPQDLTFDKSNSITWHVVFHLCVLGNSLPRIFPGLGTVGCSHVDVGCCRQELALKLFCGNSQVFCCHSVAPTSR